jgi:hypothetical protein
LQAGRFEKLHNSCPHYLHRQLNTTSHLCQQLQPIDQHQNQSQLLAGATELLAGAMRQSRTEQIDMQAIRLLQDTKLAQDH